MNTANESRDTGQHLRQLMDRVDRLENDCSYRHQWLLDIDRLLDVHYVTVNGKPNTRVAHLLQDIDVRSQSNHKDRTQRAKATTAWRKKAEQQFAHIVSEHNQFAAFVHGLADRLAETVVDYEELAEYIAAHSGMEET